MIAVIIAILMILGCIVGAKISERTLSSTPYAVFGLFIGFVIGMIIDMNLFYALKEKTEPNTTKVLLQEIDDTEKYVTQTFDANSEKVYKVQPVGEDVLTYAEDKCIVHITETETPYVIITKPSKEMRFWLLTSGTSYEIYLTDESQME